MSDNIERAVDWFNQNYQIRFLGRGSRRQMVLESVVTGLNIMSAEVSTRGSTSIEIPTVELSIPESQLTHIITELWLHNQRNLHPAVAEAYQQYLTLLHLTERNEYYGQTK